MRTRYKALSVVVAFCTFYFALIPALHWCLDSDADCTVWQELIRTTRPVIPADAYWNSSGEIPEWGGTLQGKDEAPSTETVVLWNVSFLLSMVVLPGAVIVGIAAWDKKR